MEEIKENVTEKENNDQIVYICPSQIRGCVIESMENEDAEE